MDEKQVIVPRDRSRPVFAVAFGCSHLDFLLCEPDLLERIAPGEDLPYVRGKWFPGGSIAGLREKDSTLNTKAVIRRRASAVSRLVLSFGQVDLEFGFYYRNLIKREAWAPEAYVDWLIGIYAEFLRGLERPAGGEIAVKAPNLTVCKTDAFRVRYMSTIIAGKLPPEVLAALPTDLTGTGMAAAEQDAMTLRFNAQLAALCETEGWGYFDLNAELAARDDAGLRDVARGVDPAFVPAADDHHLADTLEVRRLHLKAMRAAFS